MRIILALVLAADIVGLTIALWSLEPSAASHPWVSDGLLGLERHPLFLLPIASVGLAASASFALRPLRLASGLLALVCAGLLVEAHAAHLEGPMRIFFAAGGMLFGWLVGASYAKARGYIGSQAEKYADIGAATVLACNYVNAVLSKLLAGGVSWMPADSLRAIVLTQHPIDRPGWLHEYAALIGNHQLFAQALVVLTLLSQASAFLYPWSPRLRMVSGLLILGFHLNTAITTSFVFPQATVLLIAFSFPWPKLFRAARAVSMPVGNALFDALAVRTRYLQWLAVGGAIAWVGPLHDYGILHHRFERSRNYGGEARSVVKGENLPDDAELSIESLPPPEREALLELLGPLSPGSSALDWSVTSISLTQDRQIALNLLRGGSRLTIRLARPGQVPHRAPLETARFQLFHGPADGIPPKELDAILGFVGRELRKTEKGVSLEWLFEPAD